MIHQGILQAGIFGFSKAVEELFTAINSTADLRVEISKICTVHYPGATSIPESVFTSDPYDLLYDKDTPIIVEMLNHPDAAYNIIKTSLMQGKAVISMNNQLNNMHVYELIQLQQTFRQPLLSLAKLYPENEMVNFDHHLLQQMISILRSLKTDTAIANRMYRGPQVISLYQEFCAN